MSFTEFMGTGLFGMLADAAKAPAFWILGYFLSAVCAYLLGSLNFGIIISSRRFHDDVRTHGSGNAGMTNMLRTYGKTAVVMTLLGDGLKAAVSILVGTLLASMPGAYIAGLFCIIGHAFPLYYHFKGGKGVVTTAVMILILDPLVFLIVFTVFLIIVGMTRYVSLGSIISVLMYPMIFYNFNKGGMKLMMVPVTILIAALVVFLHRSNIKRLREGKENKLSFGSKKKKKKNESDAAPADSGDAGEQ